MNRWRAAARILRGKPVVYRAHLSETDRRLVITGDQALVENCVFDGDSLVTGSDGVWFERCEFRGGVKIEESRAGVSRDPFSKGDPEWKKLTEEF